MYYYHLLLNMSQCTLEIGYLLIDVDTLVHKIVEMLR